MSAVPKGVVVKISHTAKFDHTFSSGTELTSVGEDFAIHYRGTWSLFETKSGVRQYLLPEHYVVIETKTVKETVVDTTLPTKVVYAVVSSVGDIMATTDDRESARDVKSILGGKRKGIKIYQYAAVKEIR